MAFLKVTQGDLKGTRFQIDRDEIVIGRSPENVVHIDDPSVSGRHCVIRRDGRRFTLTDLKSTNGTRLNDVRVDSYRLSAKDVISVGSVHMLFDGSDIEDAHPTQVPPTIVQPAAHSGASTPQASGNNDANTFHKRQNRKGLWIGLSVAFAILALGTLAWFLLSVFTG